MRLAAGSQTSAAGLGEKRGDGAIDDMLSVADCIGDAEGDADGDAEGDEDGEALGLDEGEADGDDDGDFDGRDVEGDTPHV